MKKGFKFILFFIPLFYFTQDYRFIYSCSYKNEKEPALTETFDLIVDVVKNSVNIYPSTFLERKNYYIFSLIQGNSVINRNLNSSVNNTMISSREIKFNLQTEDKLDWKISSETKKNDSILLQKATLNFGGRNWVAWFNKNIPIAEGPFKFNKLPGLIFEMNDVENTFSFELRKIEKISKTTKRYVENYKKNKIITWDEYNYIMSNLISDPYMLEGRNPLEGVVPGSLTIDGVKINAIEDFNHIMRRRVLILKEACTDFLEKDRFKIN